MTIGRALTLVAIALVFVALAKRYWGREISAGPTILNVGAIALLAFVGFTYARDATSSQVRRDHESSLERDYETCVQKVLRSAGSREYNLFFIHLITQAYGAAADRYATMLSTELDRDLPPLTVEKDCPPIPSGLAPASTDGP